MKEREEVTMEEKNGTDADGSADTYAEHREDTFAVVRAETM